MKVLLIKDVYKLGRAGDIKKVADGYGRNYLIPQQLAVLATPGAIKQAEYIRATASVRRQQLNSEMSEMAEKFTGLVLTFPSKAGETGKLYGSITTQMIADAIAKKLGEPLDRRQIEVQPIRNLGEHKAIIRLTMDLTPEIKIIVHREGETPLVEAEAETEPAPAAAVVEVEEEATAPEPIEEAQPEE
ncbi:MAG: 50S ribosomal protein L9 [Chloroflexi bacterium]|nr:50S ribosomal protein L9 [Chloroflexota bacterium]